MNKMKAAVRREYCSYEDLKVEAIDKPVPGVNDILIEVYATTVNRTDCAVLTGKPFIMRFFTGLFRPKLIVPGTDFAGVVACTGNNVTSFKTGDRVFGFQDSGTASQGEYMTVQENGNIIKIPDNTDYLHAAACIEGGHYAYNFLKKINISNGQKILINGADGAIGSAMIQLVKLHDIYVTAVCRTDNVDMIRSLDADKIYDYTKEDFTADDQEYDYVLDAVGKSTFGKCRKLLKNGGIYISSELGPMIQNPFLALTTKFFGKKKVVFPVPTDTKRSLAYFKELLEKKKYHPLIDKVYPLEDISEAYNYVSTGMKNGNVVLDIANKDQKDK